MATTTQKIITALEREGIFSSQRSGSWKAFSTAGLGNILDFLEIEQVSLDRPIDRHLREIHRLPVVNLSSVSVQSEVVKLLPRPVCLEHAVVAFHEEDGTVYVAMTDPENIELRKFLEQHSHKRVVAYLADRKSIMATLAVDAPDSIDDLRTHLSQLITRVQAMGTDPEVMAKELPVIQLLDQLLVYAARSRASDLHFEATASQLIIRMRVDGQLHEAFRWPRQLHAPLIARIKILGRMRIDEHLRPQDARFTFAHDDVHLALRVSIVPALYGQKCVLRLLPTDATRDMTIDQLGFPVSSRPKLDQAIRHPHGLILVSGPTGAGKTTTLYSLLNVVRNRSVNISTIEDPVEYHIPGVTQINVNPDVGLTFATGLRSLLRQDPDVIMVGEIRDRETAEIAINAALTGHLVLSSLHTNSAAAAVTRLLDLGIEPYLIASTLRTVINQRLVRRVCPHCAAAETAAQLPEQLAGASLAPSPLTIARGRGCDHCLNTGYHERLGIFELLEVNEPIQQGIQRRLPAGELENLAVTGGMRTLRQDGLDKIISSTTTPEEVLRVIS